MTPKKKSKLPIVLLALLVLGISLGGGYAAGNVVQNETGHNPLNEALGIDRGYSTNANDPNADISQMVTVSCKTVVNSMM